MRYVDIYQCDHIFTSSPIYVIDWLVGRSSFFSNGPDISFSVYILQLQSMYRQVYSYENLRKQELSGVFASFIEGG